MDLVFIFVDRLLRKTTFNMETTEIRQNKKTLIPMLALLTVALFGMIYYIYFSHKFDNNNTMKVI